MSRTEHTADVIIAGAGGAGMAAAIAALEEGASVLLVEAAPAPGGTTAMSGGAFWIPNNSLMRAAGLDDPRPQALALMARLSFPALYDPTAPFLGLDEADHALLEAFYDEGPGVIDTLMRLGALRAMILPSLGASPSPISDPDYHAELPENVSPYGRVLTAIPDPGAMVWPGVFLAQGLRAHLEARGATFLCGATVTDVTTAHDRVTGLVATHEGRTIQLRARRGVVFTTGGFAHSAAKVAAHLRGPIFGSGSIETGTGVFLDIGARLGARLGNLNNAFFYQVALEEAVTNEGRIRHLFAHGFLPYGDSSLLVNRQGQRCVNEKAMYHPRTQSHFAFADLGFPNALQLLIYDAAVAHEPTFWPWRGVVPFPGMSSPFVIQADTLPALAEAVAARLAALRGARGLSGRVNEALSLAPDFAARLEESVAAYNAAALQGVDADFHRGETPIQQAWQGPSQGGPNRTMFPLRSEGPYFCVPLVAGVLDTCGGPVIGPDGAVIHRSGAPIAGLYGAGNCIASPAGQGYWGAGGTIGPALTFGFLAGRSAARGR